MQEDKSLLDCVHVKAEAAVKPETTKEGTSIHKARKEEEPHPWEQEQHARSYDSVKINYLKSLTM